MTAETKRQPSFVESMSLRKATLCTAFCFPGFWIFSQKYFSTLKKVKIFPSREIIFCLDLTANPRQGINFIHFIIQVFASNWKQAGKTHVLGSFKPFKYN